MAHIGQQARAKQPCLHRFGTRLERLGIELGVAHGAAELIGQRLQRIQFGLVADDTVEAVQIEYSQNAPTDADGQDHA